MKVMKRKAEGSFFYPKHACYDFGQVFITSHIPQVTVVLVYNQLACPSPELAFQ